MIPEEILLVNDGSLLLQVMGCLLETRGYRLHLTESPEEALVRLNGRNVQLVIMKLKGKQLDRLSVMHMVKELNADTRLIIMAEKASLPAEIFDIEADDYLLLPCRIGEIWRRLSIHLEPSFRKPGSFREKGLVHQVNRRMFDNLSLLFQDMRGQATSIAKGLKLLKLKLNGRVEGEAEAAFQETLKRTQTLIGMTEDLFHNFLSGSPATPAFDIVDLEPQVAQPALKEPCKGF